jgi:hypothetical protein
MPRKTTAVDAWRERMAAAAAENPVLANFKTRGALAKLPHARIRARLADVIRGEWERLVPLLALCSAGDGPALVAWAPDRVIAMLWDGLTQLAEAPWQGLDAPAPSGMFSGSEWQRDAAEIVDALAAVLVLLRDDQVPAFAAPAVQALADAGEPFRFLEALDVPLTEWIDAERAMRRTVPTPHARTAWGAVSAGAAGADAAIQATRGGRT